MNNSFWGKFQSLWYGEKQTTSSVKGASKAGASKQNGVKEPKAYKVVTKHKNGFTIHYFKDKKKTLLHREDGPAVVKIDGVMYEDEWWVDGVRTSVPNRRSSVMGQIKRRDHLFVESIADDFTVSDVDTLFTLNDGGTYYVDVVVSEDYANGVPHHDTRPSVRVQRGKYLTNNFMEAKESLELLAALTNKDYPISIWCRSGKKHRFNGPALGPDYGAGIAHSSNSGSWPEPYVNQKFPITLNNDANPILSVWKMNGVYHRANGPAVIRVDGTQEWYWCGKLHRLDGPAVVRGNGYEEYAIESFIMSKSVWRVERKNFLETGLTVNIGSVIV